MKDIFVSSVRDESNSIFQLAEQFSLGIEILGFIEPYLLDNYETSIANTKEKLSNIVKRSLHGPFIDMFPGSSDPEIVNVVRNRFLAAYRTAEVLDARHIVFHANYIHKATFPETWLDNSVRFWNSFLLEVSENIEIHIENICEDDYSLIRELVEAVNSPRFSVCLDIGHANIHSTKSLVEWIKGLGDAIKYVHLHNNDGMHDKHWGLCRGGINVLDILEQLEIHSPSACWSLETKTDETLDSIKLLNRYGFVK